MILCDMEGTLLRSFFLWSVSCTVHVLYVYGHDKVRDAG